ncbi:MAG: glycosyltransferase family 9 protein [Desulfobaccales bacterium]
MNPRAARTEAREMITPGALDLRGIPAPRRILVLQLARLGDLVQTWPLLARLRQAYPDARLTLLTDQRLLALSAMGPRMDEVQGFDYLGLTSRVEQDWPGAYQQVAGLLQDLRTREFDLIFNLNFSRLSLLLTYLLGAPARGFLPAAGGREISRGPWLAWIYSLVHARRFNRFHLTDVFRHLAPDPAVAVTPAAPAVFPGGEPLIALQLATSHARRTWPLEHFTRLAEFFVSRMGARVLLLGTKAERGLGERLRSTISPASRERVVNLQGQTGLEELTAQLKQTNFLVSGDTGTLHLAAALGVPTLALFLGPALCFETGPYGCGHYVLQAEPPCHPCLEAASPCPQEGQVCLQMLPPLAVAQLVAGLLEQGAVPPDLRLPAGARLYRSRIDAFGVFYQPLGDPSLRFLDLVGQAYRQTGVWLAGAAKEFGGEGQGPVAQASRRCTLDSSPNHPGATPYGGRELSSTALEGLQALLDTLRRGVPAPLEMPEVAAALKPLLAFQGEMQRQLTENLFSGASIVFTAQLESWLNKTR